MKILFIFLSLFSVALCQEQLKVCLHTSDTKPLCDQLNINSNIFCMQGFDSSECSLAVQNGEADLTFLYPEQVHLASSFISKQTAVIGEIRAVEEVDKPHNFQMVTVVKSEHTGGMEGLKGKKYCHPGFSGHNLWTPRNLKEFEYGLFGEKMKNGCSKTKNITNVEKELQVLHEFFGPSCRRGPWSADTNLNDILEEKYSKLTSLCKNSPDYDVLSCLKILDADVAYSTLKTVNSLPAVDKNKYKILCRNGTLIPITPVIDRACAWRNQPWTLVIANNKRADFVKTMLKDSISLDFQHLGATPYDNPSIRTKQPWHNNLATAILTDTTQFRLYFLRDTPAVSDYLQRNKQDINSFVQNECPVRWCSVSQLEEDKCNWMARATSFAGIEPQISCVRGAHIYDCLRKIKNNNADIIAIDSNYGYLARRMGLQNLLYSKTSSIDIASIVAVLPEESPIKSFNDLKGKKACFSEYRGLAWVSFITTAHTNNVMAKNCQFGKTVSAFFSGVCAPGAKDDYHYRHNHEVYDKLCSVCSANCESDNTNIYFNSNGALNCLVNHIADVAFLKWQAIEKEPNLNNYKILCSNNKIMTIGKYKENSTSCSLSDTVDSEVIIRSGDTRKIDYVLGLSEMDDLFGIDSQNEKIFNMYKEFNGAEGLIFKGNVLALDNRQSENTFVKNYVKLFETAEKCTSGVSVIYTSISLLITSLLLLILH